MEADARPVKTYRTGYQHTAPTMSRNPRKNKASGNTTPTISTDHLKVGQQKPTSVPSPYHFKGVTREKTTAAVSRNPFKVEHRTTAQSVSRNGTKEKSSPTSRKTAQALPRKVTKIEREKPTKSQKSHSKEMKIKLKNKDMNHTESVGNISATSVLINAFSTQTVPKQSQIIEHLARPSPVNVRASSLTTSVLPSTLHSLKKQTLAGNKTSAFMNNTEKLESSNQVVTQSRTTSHSSQPKPMLASSLIFYSKASTSAYGSSSKYGVGNDLKYNSQHTDNDTSCKNSAILQDVSPPAGQQTALGPVSDMRTCIQLACDVGGDVAYMRSSHCFVITCQSTALCGAGDLKPGGSPITSAVAFLRKLGHPFRGR